MALKWMDGAETWGESTYASRAYADTGSLSTTTPRVSPGLRAWNLNNSRMQTPSLGVQNTWVVGMGIFMSAVSTFQIRFFSGGTEQCRLEVENSGGLPRFKLMRGATQIDVSPTFALSQWFYFEFKVDVLTASATYELRQNEVNVMSGSGANLANLGSNGADQIGWGYHSSGSVRVDDVYILDTTGSTNTDFLGDSVCVGIIPDGDGHQNDFTRSAGATNFSNVDDPSTSASSSDYNHSDTNAQEDYYTFENLPATGLGTIHGIRPSGSWAMASTGSRVARYRYYNGSTEFTLGSNVTAATTALVELPQIAEVNPDTGVKWLKTEVDAAEFGVEVVS